MISAETLLETMAPVTLADKPLFDRYLEPYPQNSCEMTFTNFLLWGESRQHLFCEYEGHLLVSFKKRDEDRKWYPPVGPKPAETIRELFLQNAGFHWFYVDEKIAETIRELSLRGLIPRETPERFDYIYSVAALQELKGNDYMEKRNFINRCRKHNPEVVILNSSHQAECQAMLERWFGGGDKPGMSSALDEISSLRLAMEHFDTLRLTGVGIRINGQLEAFAIGAPLNKTMFVEHFEKSSNAYPGLYPLVLHEFAKVIPEAYTELNREEDLGIPGLRTAKERWHPLYLVKKYSL